MPFSELVSLVFSVVMCAPRREAVRAPDREDSQKKRIEEKKIIWKKESKGMIKYKESKTNRPLERRAKGRRDAIPGKQLKRGSKPHSRMRESDAERTYFSYLPL